MVFIVVWQWESGLGTDRNYYITQYYYIVQTAAMIIMVLVLSNLPNKMIYKQNRVVHQFVVALFLPHRYKYNN